MITKMDWFTVEAKKIAIKKAQTAWNILGSRKHTIKVTLIFFQINYAER